MHMGVINKMLVKDPEKRMTSSYVTQEIQQIEAKN